MSEIRRALAGVLLAGTAATGAVALGAGSASAATGGYVNDFVQKYSAEYNLSMTFCQAEAADRTSQVHTYNPDPNTYYYCANGGYGTVNLWFRHAA
ncbi:hypothetical protein ACGFWD_43700 [Streptomyces sp. NPDC048448]|uniref:hypothetical protein n=1 Tax=Streptomyces sp. NPDC048448 TaxID=3365554 RepID=UPI0037189A87